MIYVCIEFCAYGFAPPLLLNLSSAVIEVSNVLLYVSLSSAESKWYLCCLERSFIVPSRRKHPYKWARSTAKERQRSTLDGK